MALGTQTAPYIHTSFKNFSARSLGTGGWVASGMAGNKQVDDKIKELTRIRDGLKTKADRFLGGQDSFYGVMGIRPNSCADYALQILQNREFYATCAAKLSKYNINELPETEIINAIRQDITGEITESQLIKRIIDQSFGAKIKGKLSVESINSFVQQVFNSSEIIKEITHESAKVYSGTGKKSRLYQELKKELRTRYNNTSVADVVKNEFTTRFRKLIQNKLILDDESPENFLSSFTTLISKYLSNSSGRDWSNLLGAGGEEMFASVINSLQVGPNSISVNVVGKTSEDDLSRTLKNTITPQNFNLRDTSKQSYSDLIFTRLVLTRNGESVRVQSKNYLTPIAKFEKNAQQDLLLRARLLENEDIGSFFERMNRAKSLTFSNLNDIAYVIANEAWFSTAGNIRQKHLGLAAEDHDVESMSLHQNMIDYVLSEALLNYLGIIAVKQMNGSNAIDFNYSNIFFMVGNRQLLPTYKIVEGLIQNLKDWTKNTYTLSVQLNRKKLNFKAKDATNLLKSKEEAVASEGGFNNLNYNNSSLVGVGTEIGADIIEKLSISSINLEVSLKALFDSSYSFY